MRRADRLWAIQELLRSGRLLRADELAERLEVSLRTVQRDIDTLVASGMPIASVLLDNDGVVGYALQAPVLLPPLALTLEELQALQIGMELVAESGGSELSEAAQSLIDKLDDVLPPDLQYDELLSGNTALVDESGPALNLLPTIRRAVAERQVIEIDYHSLQGERTTRRIRPLQTERWGQVWTCPAWCEKRSDFRVFRIDRIEACRPTGELFPDEAGKRYVDYLAQLDPEDTA